MSTDPPKGIIDWDEDSKFRTLPFEETALLSVWSSLFAKNNDLSW